MFYDSNDIQLSTETRVVMNEDTAAKYRALQWEVIEIDGNDVAQIRQAIEAAKAVKSKPTLIIGKCIMGKGALKADGTSYENTCKTHGAPLGGDACRNTITHLGGNPDDPFQIFPEVKEIYDARLKELQAMAEIRHDEEANWAEKHPEKAAELDNWFAGRLPEINWESVQPKANDATRNASSACLSLLAQQVPNMICSSADLCNSDKTDADSRTAVRRFLRRIPSGRCGRAHHGMLLHRHGSPWRRDSSLRHLLRLQRLYEASHPHGSPHGTAREVHLVT